MKEYYFSIANVEDCDSDEEELLDGLIVCISPKDYTDENGGMAYEHLTDELEPIIGNLPFILEEVQEGQFLVWDLSRVPKKIPSSEIKNVAKEIVKLGCFEEVSHDFWYQ